MDVSPLHRLPAELRNDICELAPSQPTAIRIKYAPLKPGPNKGIPFTACHAAHSLALTETCKQIATKTKQLFITCTAFKLMVDYKSAYGYGGTGIAVGTGLLCPFERSAYSRSTFETLFATRWRSRVNTAFALSGSCSFRITPFLKVSSTASAWMM